MEHGIVITADLYITGYANYTCGYISIALSLLRLDISLGQPLVATEFSVGPNQLLFFHIVALGRFTDALDVTPPFLRNKHSDAGSFSHFYLHPRMSELAIGPSLTISVSETMVRLAQFRGRRFQTILPPYK